MSLGGAYNDGGSAPAKQLNEEGLQGVLRSISGPNKYGGHFDGKRSSKTRGLLACDGKEKKS